VAVKTNALNDNNEKTLVKLQTIQKTIQTLVMDHAKQLTNSNQKISRRELQKMYEANKVDNLYIDSDMIHFIFAIIPFAEYNGPEFLLFVRGVNNILKIKREIEEFNTQNNNTFPENTSEMFEIVIQLKSNTVNNLHNFVYSIPKQKQMLEYLDSIVEKYDVLISRNLDDIQKYYFQNIDQRGIKNTTKFVSYNSTKPYDAMSNHSLIPKKMTESKIINYYY
jgi:hypothetical protein